MTAATAEPATVHERIADHEPAVIGSYRRSAPAPATAEESSLRLPGNSAPASAENLLPHLARGGPRQLVYQHDDLGCLLPGRSRRGEVSPGMC